MGEGQAGVWPGAWGPWGKAPFGSPSSAVAICHGLNAAASVCAPLAAPAAQPRWEDPDEGRVGPCFQKLPERALGRQAGRLGASCRC